MAGELDDICAERYHFKIGYLDKMLKYEIKHGKSQKFISDVSHRRNIII